MTPVPRGQVALFIFQSAVEETADGAIADVSEFDDGGWASLTFQIVGITEATLTPQATLDGTNYVAVLAENVTTGSSASTATADGIYRVNVLGFQKFKLEITTYVSGTIDAVGYFSA